jgi:CHAT domain-containing protein/tetratricopeptide (TPR) repeat protein
MTRSMALALAVFVCALLAVPAAADEQPKNLSAQERKELATKWRKAITAGVKAYHASKGAEAVKAFEEALALARRLYPKAEFPDGHADLARSLNNLGLLYHFQGRLAEAAPLSKEALDMQKRLHKGDHPVVASSLNNLGSLYQAQGKLAKAAPLLKDALDMNKRLFTGDHPTVAQSLNNLGSLYQAQGKLAEAAPLYKDALDMRQRLFKGDHPDVASSLNNLAGLYRAQGRLAEAAPLYKDSLDMFKRLFKGDHPDLAVSLNSLGLLYQAQGKLAEAAPLLKDALEMRLRLFKGDHAAVATSLNNLGLLYQAQGKLAEAAPLLKDALEMRQRLFKGDHPDVATSLDNLGALYRDQRKLAEAAPLLKDALDMHKRLFKGDHPDVATSLGNLGSLYWVQGKHAEATPLLKDALDMKKRLHKGDHPAVAIILNNLGGLYVDQGKLIAAAPLFKHSLDMKKRLFKGDHPDVAGTLINLAGLYQYQGKLAEAASLLKDALDLYKRLAVAYAKQRSEGEALTFASAQPLAGDGYLSVARLRGNGGKYDPGSAYPAVWATKGMVARVFEQRQARARAAATDTALAKQLDELAGARRRRADLLLAPATKDPGTRKQREADLKALDATIAKLNESLVKALPTVARLDRLDKATAADLRKALPADSALVDYVRYVFFEWDDSKPAGHKEKWTPCYLAFVVTRDKVIWVDLDTEEVIGKAVGKWREAIVGDREVPASLGAKVRELVWDRVRKALPKGTKTVYVCPDAELCRLPFAALPGDRPNTVLLEDFALAVVPHAPFLLDQLWHPNAPKGPPSAALVVGGVKYDADVAADAKGRTGSGPLLKPGQKLAWAFLKGSVAEADAVASSAQRQKLTVARLGGASATAAAVLDALPRARVAHLATHGFFADRSFRGLFQLDEKDYEQSRLGERVERVGRAANSPLVMTGLVLAGANNPKTPGRGVLTGEALIDRDLSGLELAVLSACETGLGDLGGGGEGVFGLQRALHYAGCRNVVASLWKVDDTATAALMGEFYRQLWEQKRPPIEALRRAQLAVYRADPKQFRQMAARGLGSGSKELKNLPVLQADARDARAGNRPALWAAFTLSGLGR